MKKKILINLVNEYLEQNENATTEDLLKVFPKNNDKTIKNYHYLFRKAKGLVITKKDHIRQKVFNYLDELNKNTVVDIVSSDLKTILDIKLQTATAYLHSYRKKHNLLERVRRRHLTRKYSTKALLYGFLNNEPDKRTVVDIVKTFPHLKNKHRTVSHILLQWSRDNNIKLPKGASTRNWSDEELADLKKRSYGTYVSVMHRLEKEPEPKVLHPMRTVIKKIRSEMDIYNITSKDACILVSCNPSVELLKNVCKENPDINEEKTIEVIRAIEKRLYKKNIYRTPAIKVCTAIWLGNRDISQEQSSRIIKEFGGCTGSSIRALSKIVKIKKPTPFQLKFSFL